MESSAARLRGTSSRPPHKRRLRNYLLDPSFQLKYAGFVAAVALVIGSVLCLLLWRSNAETLRQSEAAVSLGREVLSESQKVSEVVQMNIVQDPQYNSDPILRKAFEADAAAQKQRLAGQQAQLQRQTQLLMEQRRNFAILLIGAMGVLVVALWLAGIVITHRVAGPIYKMRRQLRALEKGSLRIPEPLRKGDELKSFFDGFDNAVAALRRRQSEEVAQIDAVLASLSSEVAESQLAALRELRKKMSDSLKV